MIIRLLHFSLLVVFLFASSASASPSNPGVAGQDHVETTVPSATGGLLGFDDRDAWALATGTLPALIDFEPFADGTLITNQLAPQGIVLVSGASPHCTNPSQFVTASTSLPFPMFTSGTLPSEPNFLSSDLSSPCFATGNIDFQLSTPVLAIGAFIADGAPLGGFTIEVFDNNVSLGSITVGPRTLPKSFVGVVSGTAFDEARFISVSPNDSWGLDNLELATGPVSVEESTWGRLKSLYR